MKVKFHASCSRRCHQSAFTLIEVLIATVIALFMFISYYAVMSEGVQIIQVAREDLRATQILNNRMEGIRLYTFDQLTNQAYMPTSFTETFYPAGTVSDRGFNYTGVVSVANATLSGTAPSYANNMYQITISLTWQSTGALHTRQMTTYCGKYGIQNYVWSSD